LDVGLGDQNLVLDVGVVLVHGDVERQLNVREIVLPAGKSR
jgi:hypothetical protein